MALKHLALCIISIILVEEIHKIHLIIGHNPANHKNPVLK